ncbi:CDK-activating kinase assembly factor [Daldinia caldariorum]|uniref:CDK-activating kinase assembly factor n=1 Tax=Daldinia caldariorum TaxID=326644 RepID=UPI00200860BE|nr:CDK-activating kinase assembly factor [Daldinia caldariorum]KAI1464297.1 CDK-activating kinase assembly factor [Daldinia caldariorum]
MSRKHITGSTTVRSAAEPSSQVPTDICPVCTRVRYLNKDMEFLINPECYHPMCTNCVSNIFGKGPAQCPYASCTKTLRQRGFRTPFFKDLRVEREVDVRRRVQAVFNMAPEDFVSLRDYNDYLQQVEDLTFDLVNGDENDQRNAEQKLLAYEQKHKDDIEKNRKRGREADSLRRQREAAEAEAARQRRLEEQRGEERARAEEASINAEVMEALERGEPGTAAEIQARIIAQKRARVAEIAGSRFSSLLGNITATATTTTTTTTGGIPGSGSGSGSDTLLSIRGLKDKNKRDEDADYYLRPYDAFAGLDLKPTRYELRDRYDNPWLEDARTRDDHRVPGYSAREYEARAMFDAFAGLGVFIAEEKKKGDDDKGGDGGDGKRKVVGTVVAVEGARRMVGKVEEDVFA